MDTGDTSNKNGNDKHDPEKFPTQSNQAVPSQEVAPVEPSKPEASAGSPAPIEFDRHQLAVLATLETGLTRSGACKAAQVGRSTFYEFLAERTPRGDAFRAAVAEAERTGTHSLIDEAHRRATEGWEEPRFDKLGHVIGSVRKYDSELLRFLIKQRDHSFREKYEVTGANGAPLNPDKVEHTLKFDFSDMDADEVNDLYSKLRRSRVLPSTGN